MEEINKIINPILFLIILICFFLPFFNLTCQQQKLASVSGLELISGTSISTEGISKGFSGVSIPDLNKNIKNENVSPEPLAFVAFLLALGGFIISFFWKFAKIGSAIAGLLGTIVLIFLSSIITVDILGKVHYQLLNIECAFGYYLALLLFVTVMVYNAYLFIIKANYTVDNSTDLYERMRICPACGTVNDRVSMYCNKCGGSMDNFLN